jgi:hypothetical protein
MGGGMGGNPGQVLDLLSLKFVIFIVWGKTKEGLKDFLK